MISTSRTIDLRVNTSTVGTGRDGIDGDDGLSAYELAVQEGFIGTLAQWLESLKVTTTSWGNVEMDWLEGNPIAIRKYTDDSKTTLLETITPTFVDGYPTVFASSTGKNIELYWTNGLPTNIQRS